MQAMHGDRAKALTAVGAGKGQAKTQDEARRAEVSTKIEGIYGKTKDEVTVILNGIDPQVDAAFKDGDWEGVPRLWHSDDWVRTEITLALDAGNIDLMGLSINEQAYHGFSFCERSLRWVPT